jgi:cell division transport system permease protein
VAFPYAFRLAARSIIHEKWINLLSILTITAGILFAALTVLSIYNLDMAAKKLPEKFSMMLYLKDDSSQTDLENIMSTVKKDIAVEKVKYIPKDEALKEFKNKFKDTQYVLDGIGENPLPNSIEIKLKNEAVGPDTARRLTEEIKKMEGIDDIVYGEKFLNSIYSLKVGMDTVSIVFVIIMSAGMIFVCYSTVKILFYRRNEEIETYKLLGATRGFIRAPFIIEGAFIGLSSGILSLIGIMLLFYAVINRLINVFPLLKAISFPIETSIFLPLVGLLIGITGATIAIGRVRY